MSIDVATVRRVAKLARLALTEDEARQMMDEINAILGLVEQLGEVNVNGVEPMTSVMPLAMKKRTDIVNDGNMAERIVANAPLTEQNFFLVPKVVE
jgi:aspartyl-tRNA(Asn)/glutamyl-tRNA(Gln) amidotransferase subunit C